MLPHPEDLHADHDAEALAAGLDRETAALDTHAFLARMVRVHFPDRVCLTSSFGAESAVLLKLVADIAPDLPVVFLDTGWSFAETLRYKEELIERLGLTNVRDQRPDSAQLAAEDPDNTLWQRDPDRCCFLRKVLPLEQALDGFDAWVTGIKRGQTAHRARTPRVGTQGRLIKICPLADWDMARVQDFMREHRLPQHPLLAQAYASVGCIPCTAPVAPGAHTRAGRWAGQAKTECGIHLVRFQGGPSEQRPLPFARVSESVP